MNRAVLVGVVLLLLGCPTDRSGGLQLVEVSQDRKPQEMTLRRKDFQMGDPRPRIIVEGTVSNDGARTYCGPRQPAQVGQWRESRRGVETVCLVQLDFTLHPLAKNKVCRRLTYRVTFADGVRILDLYPRSLKKPADVAKGLLVSAADQLVPAATVRAQIAVAGLEPVVTGHRERGPSAYWMFETGRALHSGVRSVYLLLTVPPGRRTLLGQVRMEALLGRYAGGDLFLFREPATTDVSPLAMVVAAPGAAAASGGRR
jgi:hypothetical protein